MSAFKYKDLMISVGAESFIPFRPCVCLNVSWAVTRPHLTVAAFDEERAYLNPCQLGRGITYAPPCLYRTEIFITCAAISNICTLRTFVEGPVAYQGPGPEDVATMKVQLQEALAAVEAQEKAAAASAQPQTEAELESLQSKLHEAISELERRKQDLRRGA